MADILPGTPSSAPPAAPVASNGHANQAGTAAAAGSAKESAVRFGGLHGGRGRKDGLVPGSAEAKEADRKKDARRKREARAQDPAPLPSAGQGLPGPDAPPGAPVGAMPGAADPAVVPWDPTALKEFFELLIPTAEELTIEQLAGKARQARLPIEIIRDIEADAKWHPMAKKGLEFSGPRVAAKWLNRFGVPSGTQDEIVLATSVAKIIGGHVKLLKRLDELIAKANVPTTKPPEEKKPAVKP